MSAFIDPAAPNLADLWSRARAVFARALAALGSIEALARRTRLDAAFRACALGWILLIEGIVRKLLLANAAALSPTPKPTPSPGKTPATAQLRAGARAGVTLDLTQPETWPARFSFALPHDDRAVPNHRAPRIRALWGDTPAPAAPPPKPAREFDPEREGFRLARRLEAVRRVLGEPLPFAQRLADLMRRAVRRFPEIVRCYAYGGAATSFYDPSDPRLRLDALRLIVPAPTCFSDSS